MGVAQFDRSGSGVLSAPMGTQERSDNLLSPKVATEGDKGPVVQDGKDGVNCATSRVASSLGRHECGAEMPSEVANRRGIETRLDSLDGSSAGANVVARGRLPNEPSLHVESAALPSDSVVVDQGTDRSLSGAHSIADLPDDNMSWGHMSSDCARARNTMECCATAGDIPDIVEQHTAAGDSRSSDTCEGFPLCDSVVAERPAHNDGAVAPSSVAEEGAALPIDIADDIAFARDRVRACRSFYGGRRDSVSSDEGDPSVMMDDFGYIYDERTDISDISCADDEFGNFTPDISGCTKSQVVDNVSEDETRNASAGLRQDCIDLDSTVFDENCSQRPRRKLRRPPRYDDYNVDFGNSQYVRRISKSRPTVKSPTDAMMNAMSVSVGYTSGADVAKANVSARRMAAHTVCATLDGMNGRVDATTKTDKVATECNVVSMPISKAPSKAATSVLGSEVNAQLGK